jgi:hypothetical protein
MIAIKTIRPPNRVRPWKISFGLGPVESIILLKTPLSTANYFCGVRAMIITREFAHIIAKMVLRRVINLEKLLNAHFPLLSF